MLMFDLNSDKPERTGLVFTKGLSQVLGLNSVLLYMKSYVPFFQIHILYNQFITRFGNTLILSPFSLLNDKSVKIVIQKKPLHSQKMDKYSFKLGSERACLCEKGSHYNPINCGNISHTWSRLFFVCLGGMKNKWTPEYKDFFSENIKGCMNRGLSKKWSNTFLQKL